MSASDVPRLFGAVSANRPHHSLRVQAPSPLTETFVINGSMELVARGQQSLQTTLPEGTYLVKFREGSAVREQFVNLSKDAVVIDTFDVKPPAPESETHKKRIDAFVRGKSLAVIVTDPDGEKVDTSEITVRRVDGGGPLWKSLSAKGFGGIAGNADPGWYLLRVCTRGVGAYEMCLWVAPGYDTRVHLTRRIISGTKGGHKSPHFGTASISMPKRGRQSIAAMPRHVHLANVLKEVLTAERPLLPSPELIDEALYVKSSDLMIGLAAAHTLHLHIQSQQATNPAHIRGLKTAIRNLLNFSNGSPDAGALAVTYGVPAGGVDFGAPPMLSQSAQMIARAQAGGLVPVNSYACRVAPATTAVRPWMVWRMKDVLKPVAVDPETITIDDVEHLRDSTHPIFKALGSTRVRETSLDSLAAAMGLPTNALVATLAQARPKKKRAASKAAREG